MAAGSLARRRSFHSPDTPRHGNRCLAPAPNDTVRITSRLIDARRLGGTWLIEVQNLADGQLLARDYSTGVHLNLEGRPAAPPAQIIQDIQFG